MFDVALLILIGVGLVTSILGGILFLIFSAKARRRRTRFFPPQDRFERENFDGNERAGGAGEQLQQITRDQPSTKHERRANHAAWAAQRRHEQSQAQKSHHTSGSSNTHHHTSGSSSHSAGHSSSFHSGGFSGGSFGGGHSGGGHR